MQIPIHLGSTWYFLQQDADSEKKNNYTFIIFNNISVSHCKTTQNVREKNTNVLEIEF